MEKKGQILLVAGILLTLLSMVLTKDFVPDSKWIFILSDILLLVSAVMVIWGFVLVVRSKFSKRDK
jgi:hypothetical protein